MNRVFAFATYDDGRRLQVRLDGDQVGVRMFTSGPGGVEQIGEWRGASVQARNVRTDTRALLHVIELDGIEDPVGFTLEHWGGCHCSNPLKKYRPPAWTPA